MSGEGGYDKYESNRSAYERLQQKAGESIYYLYYRGTADLAATKEIIRAQERGGCDVIELGVPFSDPVADGPVIQDASYRAICGGVNVKKIFAMMQELRTEGVTGPDHLHDVLQHDPALRRGSVCKKMQ